MEKDSIIRDISDLKALIEEYKGSIIGAVRIVASYKLQNLWEAQVLHNSISVLNLAENSQFGNQVTKSLDRIGASELTITDVLPKQSIKTAEEGWEQRFLRLATNEPNPVKEKELIPDTNFVMRRYATGMLRRLGEEQFSKLRFAIPNLVILEIEAIYNRAKKTSESLIELSKSSKLKPKEEKEQTKAMFDMKEALIATKELMFLRDRGAYILNTNIEAALKDLADIAGKGLTDRYIRKEIRDATKYIASSDTKFVTCDLMNALSAVAEGLPHYTFQGLNLKKGSISYRLITIRAWNSLQT